MAYKPTLLTCLTCLSIQSVNNFHSHAHIDLGQSNVTHSSFGATLAILSPHCEFLHQLNNKKDRWDSGKPHLPTNSLRWYPDEGDSNLLTNICIKYRSPTTQNLSDLDFDLSRSLKVKCDSAIGLPIYAFLLMFISNIGFKRYKSLKSSRPWVWPFKVTQGQIWWCHWTLYIYMFSY